ncbi:MAG TPA: hypothetical protein VMX75_04660, partial [Spirochaetia bacterium]|nr:hypothetical protein [Spirochaetia bacterium]
REAPFSPEEFQRVAQAQIAEQHGEYTRYLSNGGESVELEGVRREIQERMSREGAFLRSLTGSRLALDEARNLYQKILAKGLRCSSPRDLARASEDKMLALTSVAFLEALVYYLEHGGGSRGGYMVLDNEGDLIFSGRQGQQIPYRSENQELRKEILEVRWDGRLFHVSPVPLRPLPVDESWFETEWNRWREGLIYRE